MTKISISEHCDKLTIDNTPYRFESAHVTGYNVETTDGTEFVDCDDVGQEPEFDPDDAESMAEVFGEYLTGSAPWSAELVTEWHAGIVMPGNLDSFPVFTGETEVDAIREFLESEEFGACDYVIEALNRLVEIRNANTENNEQRKTSVAALDVLVCNMPCAGSEDFNPFNLCVGKQAEYSGDVHPIDHDGRWWDTSDWLSYGYANTLNICSAEDKLWLELGTTNRHETDIDEIAEMYGIDRSEVTVGHELDRNFSHWGHEIDDSTEFTRLDDSGWFLNADGQMVSESTIEARIVEILGNMLIAE